MTGGAPSLGFGRIVAYGFGDFGFNLFYTGLNLYLLFYYTDVLGIAPVTAGLIFMAPVVWDAVTDPVMGAIATRTHSRWGRYRPWILFGAPLMCLSFVGMFAAPLLFPGAVVVAALVSHLVFRTAYTVVSIPYGALSAAMTRDGGERSKLAGARMVCAIGGGVLTAFATLQLATTFGAGDLARGFVTVTALYSGLAFAIMLLLFATTREDVVPGPRAAPLTTSETWFFLKRNSAFWLLFAAVFCGAFGSSIASKALVYYLTYVAGDARLVPMLLTLSLLATGLAVPLWAAAAQRFSKRDLWVVGALAAAACQGALLTLRPTDFATLAAFIAAAGVANAAFITMFWAMLPDTVEFGQWRSGVRDEGVVFGLNQLALKAASGFGVGLLGVLLGAIGYVANAAQTPDTSTGLAWLSFGVPLVGALASAAFIAASPLTRARHDTLVKWLNRPRLTETYL